MTLVNKLLKTIRVALHAGAVSLVAAVASSAGGAVPAEPSLTAMGPAATGPAKTAVPAVRSGDGLCRSGRKQSPVDIVAPRHAALPALSLAYRPAPLRIVNDGHTVRVRFANGSLLRVGGEPQRLTQFHFHVPGGDHIAGEDFALAMHFLHKSPAGRLVSLVLLFRLGPENAALAALLPRLPERGTPERTLADATVDPSAFLPATLGYYAYDGSETSPPCAEGVRWIVMKTVGSVSGEQVARLRALFGDNARAVQPLNGRVVLESR
jgi:carbonic anhydrase